jgi:hypothetical protein
VNHFDTEELHDLLPPGICLVGLQEVFAPHTVATLDEAENAQ